MKELCFVVNVDWFFHSHRKPLEQELSSLFKTSVIAGDSGLKTDYIIKTFEVKSRVPTIRGVLQFYREVKGLDNKAILIIVSPVMIILCHFLLRKRRKVFYNFSGLGFLRSMPAIARNSIINLIKIYPVAGNRVFVVQNSDDYRYLQQVFRSKKNFHLEIIPGSGYEETRETYPKSKSNEITIGYVGRIRKDKGILDLVRAVTQLKKCGYKINLKIFGNLDDESRHGFSNNDLEELRNYSQYFEGFSENKIEMFSSFNWFCLPSIGEGLSKAAIEATSFGLPLLLSDVQGNRDMINGNGFLFKYGDLENLKEVLIEISMLSKEKIDGMSKRSKELFEATWTMKSIYVQWKKILFKYDTLSV